MIIKNKSYFKRLHKNEKKFRIVSFFIIDNHIILYFGAYLELALMSRFRPFSKFFTLFISSMHKLKLMHILFQNLDSLKFFNKKTAQNLNFLACIKGIEYY